MAAYSEVITSNFPSIDSELLEYVTGVLESGSDDFESEEDVNEAVGGILVEVAGEDEMQLVSQVCQQLCKILKLNSRGTDSASATLLDAPVHLAEIVEAQEVILSDDASIWMAKKEAVSNVDKRKLEKAEAKIKAKQEKRSMKDDVPKTNSNGNSTMTASASQATSRRDQKLEESGTNRSTDIKIENFDVAFGEKVLLNSANLLLAFGRRYGLVGRNGIGKSTLLHMISSGELRIQSHISVLHVEQEVIGDDTLAIDSVLECDTVRNNLLIEEKQLSEQLQATSPGSTDSKQSQRLNEVYQALEEIEADKAPAKAAMILAGLGFSSAMQVQCTREFSGGWRMRIALARALFSKPDLLLLDEPTNMLDIKAILWLENYLQAWPTTLLVVSHDRNFLDQISTDVLHLFSQKVDHYRGNYSQFVTTKDEKLKNQQREYEAQLQKRQHLQVFIDRFRYNANRAALVQSKIKEIERMPELKAVEKESEVVLKFPSEFEKLSPPVLQLSDVMFSYTKDKVIFSGVDLSADLDSRICIVGENGTGKTTLLKILLGDLNPVDGIRHAHRNLRISYFTQHHVDQLNMNQSAIEFLASKYPNKPLEEYRRQLGSYGVTGDLATRSVASLSGGQKSRVAFAVMAMNRPNFYILDEPTNHLDIETVEALGMALKEFKGGVVLVSHDECLIRLVCKELWVCGNGTVKAMEGGLDEYKSILEKEFEAQYNS
ncbi:ATP-binding cassette sub-family F member 3-like [Anneissia japonica]|uniref:ATP-binding cassette sub-family F member 3-like n=1 Tax=Anneissia japonica TaxID=1529436 RepID=UPI001425B1B3|nr:ATP-binding cassette sub-family F member 3-like [Anneissia japonica]